MYMYFYLHALNFCIDGVICCIFFCCLNVHRENLVVEIPRLGTEPKPDESLSRWVCALYMQYR